MTKHDLRYVETYNPPSLHPWHEDQWSILLKPYSTIRVGIPTNHSCFKRPTKCKRPTRCFLTKYLGQKPWSLSFFQGIQSKTSGPNGHFVQVCFQQCHEFHVCREHQPWIIPSSLVLSDNNSPASWPVKTFLVFSGDSFMLLAPPQKSAQVN